MYIKKIFICACLNRSHHAHNQKENKKEKKITQKIYKKKISFKFFKQPFFSLEKVFTFFFNMLTNMISE